MKRFVWICLNVLLSAALAAAQGDECPDLVESAIDRTADYCTGLERNEICYGNASLEATPHGRAVLHLQVPGDIEALENVQAVRLSAMQAPDRWGVAMLAVQANLPDTLPGQNVIMVLFGDVTLENQSANADDFNTMQAFTVRSGIAEPQCDEAPQDGLLVQSPRGVGEIRFQVNGVDIEFGSTLFLQAQPGASLRITALEGQISASAQGSTISIPPGARASIALNADNTPAAAPVLETVTADDIAGLPLRLLPERVVPPPFIDPDAIAALEQANVIATNGLTGADAGFSVATIDSRIAIYTEPQFDCPGIENVRPGMLVYFGYGVGTPPGEPASATQAEFAGHRGQITVDGVALPTFREGITSHGPNFGDRAIAAWIATPGRHVATAVWTHEAGPLRSCEFVVNNAGQ